MASTAPLAGVHQEMALNVEDLIQEPFLRLYSIHWANNQSTNLTAPLTQESQKRIAAIQLALAEADPAPPPRDQIKGMLGVGCEDGKFHVPLTAGRRTCYGSS